MNEPKPWVTRVKHIELIHKNHLRENSKWTIDNTAKELHIAKGGVSESLLLAKYMKTHPKVELFTTVQDALEYCRKLKRLERMGV